MPEFTTLKVVKTQKPKVGLVAKLRFMHGDADKYETVDIPMEDEQEAVALAGLLRSAPDRPEVEWFEGDREWLLDWWPRDVTNDWVRADLQGVGFEYTEADGTVYTLSA